MKVLVAGAGNIGRYLASDLAGRGHEVTVVEQVPEIIVRISAAGVRTVLGDACAPQVLEKAGARDADVVVAATGDDEDNLVVSLLAKQEFAVPRVLARVNHPTNEWLFDEAWGVDLAVSPPHLLTALVEEEISEGDAVSILKLELRLDERSRAVGQRVEDLALPADLVLLAVLRSGHAIACRDVTPFAAGDEVLALVPEGRQHDLRDLLVGPR
jgi:trk system potassium uptake protein TrkA